MNKPYELYKGDCLEVMDRLIKEGVTVDVIITDPPYGINYVCGFRKKKYDEIKGDDGVTFLHKYFRKCYDLLKDNTHIYCFCSWHNIDKFKVAFEKYFKLKNIIVWNKRSGGMGDLKGAYMPNHEFILFGHKGRRLRNGKRLADVLDVNKVKCTQHPTQKPTELLEIFINQSTNKNEVAFDGFMGSGSTGVACMNTNRKFIGIELDKKYFDIATSRIEETYIQNNSTK